MPAIFSTNVMIMGPAKMMDHASVILDFSPMTALVNLQRPFMIGDSIYCRCFARFPGFANQSFDKCFKKIFTIYFEH